MTPVVAKEAASTVSPSAYGTARSTIQRSRLRGHNVCIEAFGASAPLKQLLKKFDFNVPTPSKGSYKKAA